MLDGVADAAAVLVGMAPAAAELVGSALTLWPAADDIGETVALTVIEGVELGHGVSNGMYV